MKRDVFFSPAFDKRHTEPSKNYGIGAVRITFVLGDERGAVQFMVGTDWYPPHVQREQRRKGSALRDVYDVQPIGWDVGYHALAPQYEGQSVMTDSCPHLDGRPCYYDGSCLQAEPVVLTLLNEGSDGVWKFLEGRHADLFGAVEVSA